MSTTIVSIRANVLQNSRGKDTIAVIVETASGVGLFALPDGASTGSREVRVKEAHEAVAIIETVIAPALIGFDVTKQLEIDALLHTLDASVLFEKIGGNVALGVSVACCKAASVSLGLHTWEYIHALFKMNPQGSAPRLFVNLINGGKHALYGSVIQEHQIIPDTDDVALAYTTACTVQKNLETILIKQYGVEKVGKGDEGGFMIPSDNVFEPFEYLEEAIALSSAPISIAIGADVAASSFYSNGKYVFGGENKESGALMNFYDELHHRVPSLLNVEDPFFESDFESYALYRKNHPDVLVIGDDLTTTNSRSLQKAINENAINGIIIKPNQIGTLSDTLLTMKLAYEHEVQCIVSHRSGETIDDFIADLSFGTGSYGLKAGAPHATQREAKYQRLIHIQQTQHD